MAKPKKKQKTVSVVVDIELRGSVVVDMPEDEAEKLVDKLDEFRGDAHTDSLPFDVNWDELINSGDPRVEDIYIKARS